MPYFHLTNCSAPDGATPETDETETVLVLAWAVPTAAKVPAPGQSGSMTVVTLRPTAMSSTVPAKVITELRANNTVLPTNWCTTATLTAGPAILLAR
ncbi:MAG: hypothetical protein M3Y12_00935 [Bacteroidota bacterium]|nr:hypothetical protein [Bacteroidota bacterium]